MSDINNIISENTSLEQVLLYADISNKNIKLPHLPISIPTDVLKFISENFDENSKIDDMFLCKMIILYKNNILTKNLLKYSAKEIDEILNSNIPIELIKLDNFSIKHLEKFEKIKNNHDAYNLLCKGYSISITELIINFKEKGIDVTKYMHPFFTDEHVYSIANCIENDVNLNFLTPLISAKEISVYGEIYKLGVTLPSNLSLFQLNSIKHCIVSNKEYKYIFECRQLNSKQLAVIVEGIFANINPLCYNDSRLSPTHMKAILRLLKFNKENDNKIDITPFLNPNVPIDFINHASKVLRTGTKEEKEEILKEFIIFSQKEDTIFI